MIPVVGVLHALRTVDAQKSQSSGGGDQPGTGEVLSTSSMTLPSTQNASSWSCFAYAEKSLPDPPENCIVDQGMIYNICIYIFSNFKFHDLYLDFDIF